MSFDYAIPNTCQFGVPDYSKPSSVSDCGEPAPYMVWWRDDQHDLMYVCEKHFNEIRKAENDAEKDEQETTA